MSSIDSLGSIKTHSEETSMSGGEGFIDYRADGRISGLKHAVQMIIARVVALLGRQ